MKASCIPWPLEYPKWSDSVQRGFRLGLSLLEEIETMASRGPKTNVMTGVEEQSDAIMKAAGKKVRDNPDADLNNEQLDVSGNGREQGDGVIPTAKQETTNVQEDAPAKKERKKPDRSNPPYYEIYSEIPGNPIKKLEGNAETAGKALKFIYLHAARVAVDGRKLYVVRCKRLTDAELLD